MVLPALGAQVSVELYNKFVNAISILKALDERSLAYGLTLCKLLRNSS